MQEGILIQHHAPPLFRSSQNKSTAICQPAISAPSLFGIFSYLSITYEGILGLASGSESSCSPRYILKTGFPFQKSGRRRKATRSYPAVDLDYANVPSWGTRSMSSSEHCSRHR